MSAERDPDAQVFWCPLCGPCIALRYDGKDGPARLVLHNRDIEHPDWFTFDDKETPQ